MPKFHNTILTHTLSLVFSFVFIFFALVTPVSAACSAKNGACPSTQSFSCSITTTAGAKSTLCCVNSAECTQLINSGSFVGATSKGGGALKVNPEGSCSGGIDTALGCIPYDTKGFTAALLGFLAGIVGLIALMVMLVATIMIMTGGSNPEQVKKGKELFTGGITGLFFIIFSVTILRIIAGDIIKLPGF